MPILRVGNSTEIEERRRHASKLILAHFDEALFKDFSMYGVALPAMTTAELKAVICFLAKNPDVIQANMPVSKRTKATK